MYMCNILARRGTVVSLQVSLRPARSRRGLFFRWGWVVR